MLMLLLLACHPDKPTDTAAAPRPEGDAATGWDTLLYGDYVGAGLPKDIWFDLVPPITSNVLEREGEAADLPSSWNLFVAPEGVEVVGGVTCLGCHGSWLDGTYLPGLGNAFADYSEDSSGDFTLLLGMVRASYGEDSPEYSATARLVRGGDAVSDAILTPFAGINPAFALERAAAAHREPDTLEWTDSPGFAPMADLPASDTPPWWNVRKKSALYYNGMGGGDFARLIQQIGVVAIIDADHAADIDADFADVLAYVRSVEPPAWPDAVDADLAAEGQTVFEAQCSRCHGTYGDTETYDSLIIDLDEVGTDPAYAEALADPDFVGWLQASWYASGDWGASFDAQLGYVAPPLDGVWATAPYLHNGSVPDLVALLDSAERPTLWRRDFDDTTYEHTRVGWPWTVPDTADAWTYDTTVTGYSNAGHTYGDALTAEERASVLEYLKTL